MKNVINDLLLFWGIRKAPMPDAAQVVRDQLNAARLDLLEAQNKKDRAIADVDMLMARVRRLETDERNNAAKTQLKTV